MSNKPIRFFSRGTSYADFSNFAPYGFTDASGTYWPTVEHYFQAMKFDDEAYRESIRAAFNPMKAKALGKTRNLPIRPDWDDVRERIMKEALRMKFRQNAKLKERLLATGTRPLIEDSPHDNHWGCGKTGKGKNRMGELLMQVREELKDDHNA